MRHKLRRLRVFNGSATVYGTGGKCRRKGLSHASPNLTQPDKKIYLVMFLSGNEAGTSMCIHIGVSRR